MGKTAEKNRTAGTASARAARGLEKEARGVPARGEHYQGHRAALAKGAACVVVVVAMFVAALGIGRVSISPADVLGILGTNYLGVAGSWNPMYVTVVCDVRLPRLVAAVLVGSALAVSGASYQGLFQNPMVSPDILGASAGASFGAAMAILWGFDMRGVEAMGFTLGFIAVAATYLSARGIGRGANQTLLLVLCGIVVGTLFQALVSGVKYTADPESKLPEITYWLMGSLAKVTWGDIQWFMAPYLIGVVPLILLRWRLNSLSFGDAEAASLGVNVEVLRLVCILAATLLTAAVVSIAGVVGWVGLVIPHLVRFVFGPDNRYVVPMSLVLGAGFMILVDTACRTITASEIPLGILTAIIGAPFFFFILMKTQRGVSSE